MANTASIIIEVDETSVIGALKQINAEGAKVNQGLAPVPQQFDKITESTKKGREAAALLSEEFGVRMPRALRGVLAQSSLIGPAISAAFTGLAVVGFIEVVKSAVDNLTGFTEQLKIMQKQSEEVIASVEQANKTLLGPQTLGQINARILATTKSVEQLNEQIGLTGNVFGDALRRGISKFGPAQHAMVEQLDKQKTLLNELFTEQARLLDEERRTEPIQILKLHNQARLEGLEGIKRINEEERGATAVVRAEIAARITTERVGQAEITEIHSRATAQRRLLARAQNDETRHLAQQALLTFFKGAKEIEEIEKNQLEELKVLLDRGLLTRQNFEERSRSIDIIATNRRRDLAIHNAEEVQRAEEQAALDILPPWKRSYAQISLETQRRLREIQQALLDTKISSEDAARLSAAAWQENFAKARDQLAHDLEGLFDDITSGNIGKRFLTMFKHMVFEMIATWILGMNKMRAASAVSFGGGGGGILGSLFGGLFGGLGGIFGGGTGPGGTPPFFPTSGANGGLTSTLPAAVGGQLPNLGISAGGAPGAPGVSLPGGGGASVSRLGQLLSGLGGLAATGGLSLFGLARGAGPLGGAALGGLGGALTGVGLTLAFPGFFGSIGAAGLAGIAGAFTLGIGAVVGGLVGLILGFGKSTRKARLQIEAQVKDQAQKIEDSYDQFQVDAAGAHQKLEDLRNQGVDALRKAGVKDISRSRVGHVDHWVDKAEKEIAATQAERDRRSAIVFGPAIFHQGGFVHAGLASGAGAGFRASAMHFATGGEVPAILHAGEFVMNEAATSRIGVGNLSRMNAGGGQTTVNITIQAMDAKSFEGAMRDHGTRTIIREIRRAVNEGLS